MEPMIPAEAVEAALKEWACWPPRTELVTRMLEAAAPHMMAHLLTFADERDNARGAIRSHITTYELRKLLGVNDD